MIISLKKGFALLAPWKTASQTAHGCLERYNESPYSRFFYFNPHLNRVVHQHLTLADFRALPESGMVAKIGSFVRNPYDRCYSGFMQIQRDFEIQPRMRFEPKWVGDLVRDQISRNMQRVIRAEMMFDKWICELPEYDVFEAGANTNCPLHPAHYWTHAGASEVDFIGKVESFRSEFDRFCSFIGIDAPPIRIENVSDPAQHRPRSYSRYAGRMSRRALDRINDLFARDFELFGYARL
jgi:hypothetical protein